MRENIGELKAELKLIREMSIQLQLITEKALKSVDDQQGMPQKLTENIKTKLLTNRLKGRV